MTNLHGGQVPASITDVDGGSRVDTFVTPDSLAGSYAGVIVIPLLCIFYSANTAITQGIGHFVVPAAMDGMNLISVYASVSGVGTTGTLDLQVRNATKMQDMLSTVLTVDSGEFSSTTAATPAVIDTTKDDVSTGDIINIDCDAVHTTPATGLCVALAFQLP